MARPCPLRLAAGKEPLRMDCCLDLKAQLLFQIHFPPVLTNHHSCPQAGPRDLRFPFEHLAHVLRHRTFRLIPFGTTKDRQKVNQDLGVTEETHMATVAGIGQSILPVIFSSGILLHSFLPPGHRYHQSLISKPFGTGREWECVSGMVVLNYRS